MLTLFSLKSALPRSLALAFVAGSAFAVASAQSAPASDASAAQPLNFQTSYLTPSSTLTQDALFSSSTSSAEDAGTVAANTNLASLEKNLALPGANAQYGRRRYGSPRYRGGNTNADGSEKYTAFVGGGFTVPLGNTHHYDTPSWGFQVGAGRNFSKNFGLDVEFDWDHILEHELCWPKEEP